jgi:hypothetical protein
MNKIARDIKTSGAGYGNVPLKNFQTLGASSKPSPKERMKKAVIKPIKETIRRFGRIIKKPDPTSQREKMKRAFETNYKKGMGSDGVGVGP